MTERRIRILHIIGQLHGGGCERQLLGVCQRLDARRFDLSVCWYGPMAHELDGEFRAAGVNTIFFNKFSMSAWRFFLTLRRKIQEVSPDIVHTWLTSANFWGRWAAVSCGVPHIVASERSLVTKPGLIQRASERALAPRSHRLANSKVAAASAQRLSGLPAERIRVIYNAVSVEPVDREAARAEARRELGVPGDQRLVVMVAHLRPGKNYEMFVRCGARMRTLRPGVTFVSLGSGPLEAQLIEQAASLGARHDVRFLAERADVPLWLAGADLFCLTTYHEAFPNSVLEAMAAGLPIVTTPFSSLDELTGGQDLVVKVPFDDDEAMAREIAALLDDPERRRRLGEEGRSWVRERYTWERLVGEMESFYEDLVRKRVRPTAARA
jgi:glycosyltransferase involved in cell wall biosynthesis